MIFFQSDIPGASLNRRLPAYETTGLVLMRLVCIMHSVYIRFGTIQKRYSDRKTEISIRYVSVQYRVSQKSIEIRPFVLNVRCDTFGN